MENKLNNIWKITSYDEWLNIWVSTLGVKKFELPAKLANVYVSQKQYVEEIMIAVQAIANQTVGNVLDTQLPTLSLTEYAQSCLKAYTYQTVDHFLYNGITVNENVNVVSVTNSGGYNQTSASQSILTSFDFIPVIAQNSWVLSGVEDWYRKKLQKEGYPVKIIDRDKFYTKLEVDNLIRVEQVKFDALAKYTLTLPEFKAITKVKSDEIYERADKLDFHGNLVTKSITKNEDGSVNAVYNFNVEQGTVIGEIVDDLEIPVNEENPTLQANSYNQFKKLIDRIEELENREIYFDGEYKWMPTDVELPFPWQKVTMTKGLTLINGTEEGISEGKARFHQHQLMLTKDDVNVGTGTRGYKLPNTYNQSGLEAPLSDRRITGNPNWMTDKEKEGSQMDINNLAAGKYATLWQYLPNQPAEAPSAPTPREELIDEITERYTQPTSKLMARLLSEEDRNLTLLDVVKDINEIKNSQIQNPEVEQRLRELEEFRAYFKSQGKFFEANFKTWKEEKDKE